MTILHYVLLGVGISLVAFVVVVKIRELKYSNNFVSSDPKLNKYAQYAITINTNKE